MQLHHLEAFAVDRGVPDSSSCCLLTHIHRKERAASMDSTTLEFWVLFIFFNLFSPISHSSPYSNLQQPLAYSPIFWCRRFISSKRLPPPSSCPGVNMVGTGGSAVASSLKCQPHSSNHPLKTHTYTSWGAGMRMPQWRGLRQPHLW